MMKQLHIKWWTVITLLYGSYTSNLWMIDRQHENLIEGLHRQILLKSLISINSITKTLHQIIKTNFIIGGNRKFIHKGIKVSKNQRLISIKRCNRKGPSKIFLIYKSFCYFQFCLF